jgi:glycosyltransferase involved in cell wall biosynthesis
MKTNKTALLVSVIVPMRNAESYIRATLRSVLHEMRIPIEVIVVDDRSSDSSRALVSDLMDSRIRLVNGPGRGISACLNVGLEHARGTIIMRCDADDIYPPNRIYEQAMWLESNSEYDAVCGSFSTIDQAGKLVAELQCGATSDEISRELIAGRTRTHFCTYAVRSSLIRKAGSFREYFELGEDLDYQFRLGEIGRIRYEPNNWYLYRIHSESIIHTSSHRLFFEQVAKDMLRQRRTLGSDDLQRGLPPAVPSSSSAKLNANTHIQGMLFGEAWRKHRDGKKVEAIALGMRAMVRNPFNYLTLKSFFALISKPCPK